MGSSRLTASKIIANRMYPDNSDQEEDDQDEGFINTEHVSQTEELLAERRAVTMDLKNFCGQIRGKINIKTDILDEVTNEDENLQDIVVELKSLVEIVLETKAEEEEKEKLRKENQNLIKTELICIEDINDEHLKLEAKLHNSEHI